MKRMLAVLTLQILENKNLIMKRTKFKEGETVKALTPNNEMVKVKIKHTCIQFVDADGLSDCTRSSICCTADGGHLFCHEFAKGPDEIMAFDNFRELFEFLLKQHRDCDLKLANVISLLQPPD